MKHSRLALATPLAVALVVGVLMASPAAWAALVKAADWQMNESSGKMIDSSGNNNNGTPTDVLRTGSTYVFNGSTSRVAVPDNNSLDPGSRDITLRASVKVAGAALDDDSYDIVRKGYSTTPGGDYKLEILRSSSDPTVGRLHCLFKGSGGEEVRIMAPEDIVDGNWHTLACIKRSTSVVAMVDGKAYTQRGSAGSIANSEKVMVGAKAANPLDDMFEGRMNFVRIHIDR
jgi:concanavalin A-like lectin/glucanase superfamily protein